MTTNNAADVYKNGVLAARLQRKDGGTQFRYHDDYVAAVGRPVASTLPLTPEPTFTASGAVPPFFAGLLPEGRRLTALRRKVKTSSDDELSLLLAVGNDTIGDVQIVSAGAVLDPPPAATTVQKSFDEIRFADVLAEIGITSAPTLSGVQDKVSAAMISVPIRRRGIRYILKLNPPENPHLVENEAYFLRLARSIRLPAATFELIHDADGEPGLLVTRFDRTAVDGVSKMLGFEDACQTLGLWPADKYNVTMERAADSLLALTPARVIAARDILKQLTFAWLTGNGDLHAKNMGVLDSPGTGQRISPAYDLPSTLFYDDTVLALTVGGKDTLSGKRLLDFASHLGIPRKAVMRAIAEVVTGTEGVHESLAASELPFDRKLNDKVARQLATRHREIARAVTAF